VGCYIWYSEEGTGRGRPSTRPLLAVPNVAAHPSMASVPTSYYSMWHYNCLWSLKGTRYTYSGVARRINEIIPLEISSRTLPHRENWKTGANPWSWPYPTHEAWDFTENWHQPVFLRYLTRGNIYRGSSAHLARHGGPESRQPAKVMAHPRDWHKILGCLGAASGLQHWPVS